MAGFEDVWVRVNRAKANFETLKGDVAEFGREHPDNNRVGFQHDGKGHVTLVAEVTARPPKEWGLVSGDILVDLRTALDYAVYALAVNQTGQPLPPFADKLEFPICETSGRWGEAIGRHKVAGLPQGAIDYISSIQPYQPGNGGATSSLMAFDDLVGVNKHRFIAVGWMKLKALKQTFVGDGFEVRDFVGYQIRGELEDGAVLATFTAVATKQYAKLQVRSQLETFVAVEPTAKGWLDLLDFLRRLGPYVEYVLGQLEGFLTPGHETPPRGTPIPLTPW